jgi:sulfatase maturation enzyme AslB (radical SAM superfamily)
MIKNNNLKFANRLTLYTSESCNLNCSYCIMAQ